MSKDKMICDGCQKPKICKGIYIDNKPMIYCEECMRKLKEKKK